MSWHALGLKAPATPVLRLRLIELAPPPAYESGCPDLGIARCEACPLAACRYDMPWGEVRQLTQLYAVRDVLHDKRLIADRMHWSIRQAERLRAAAKHIAAGDDAILAK